MLQNYLRIALRHSMRNWFYLSVNVFGLGIAFACCIIAFLNYRYDRSFDTFHPGAEQIYRIAMQKESNGRLYGITPLPLAAEVRQEIAGVDEAVRLYSRAIVVKRGDAVYNEDVHFVDGDFFGVFHFPALAGDPGALQDPNAVLITKDMAKKYFGDENPLGQELTLYSNEPNRKALVVKGVLEDPPLNSSIRFDFLTGLENLYYQNEPADPADWSRFTDVTFLKLKEDASRETVAEALQGFVPVWNKSREDWTIDRFYMEPFLETAHNGREMAINYLMPAFPPAAVWGPGILALLILLTAGLNFVNTTVSLSDGRLKEMGIRKVLGGTRQQLVGQLLSETIIICLLAVVAGVLLTNWLLPAYNAMWPYLELTADYANDTGLQLFIAAMFLVTVVAAGSYPAVFLSGFEPANIFGQKVRFGGSHLLTRLLLGGQIVISLVAVIGGLAFAKNAKFQEETDLGYDKKGLIVTRIDGEQDYQTLRNELQGHPEITGIAGTDAHVGHRLYSEDLESRGTNYEALRIDVGDDYLKVMGLDILYGRDFRPGPEADQNAALVSERLVQNFGWEDPLGRQLTIDSLTYTVVGVVRRFIENDFFSPQSPVLFLKTNPEQYRFLIARTDPDKLPAVLKQVEASWSGVFPFRPFDAFTQEEVIREEISISGNIKTIFLFLGIITILLSSVGLFALVSLNILKRLKEIAIRRIIGASMADITYLVNRNYLWIFLGAVVLGSVGGAFFSEKLLDSIFAIHVNLDGWLFLLAALAVFFIAAITVGWKLWQVATVNPADILRSE